MSQKRKQRKPDAPAADPEPWLRYLPPELRTNPKSVAWAKAKDQSEKYLREAHCTIVDFYERYKVCPHSGCRRAGRCVDPKVPCYWAILPWLQKNLFPTLMPVLRKSVAEAEADKPPESSL